MTSMQVAALTNIARLIAEDPDLPPVSVTTYADGLDGRTTLAAHFAEGVKRLTVAQAQEVRDAWALTLGLDLEDSYDSADSGVRLRFFRASGTWAGVRVNVTTAGALVDAEAVAS